MDIKYARRILLLGPKEAGALEIVKGKISCVIHGIRLTDKP